MGNVDNNYLDSRPYHLRYWNCTSYNNQDKSVVVSLSLYLLEANN